MIYLIAVIILSLLAYIFYFMAIKPFLAIKKLKKEFQSKGFRVKLQNLNFLKSDIFDVFNKNLSKHGDALYHFRNEYQKYDVVLHNSMHHPYIMLVDIELVKDAFRQIQSFPKSKVVTNNFKRLYGGGLFMSEGIQSKEKRKLYSEIFNYQLLEELHPTISEAVQRTIDRWDVSEPLDMLKQLKKISFNSFVMSYFGCQFQNFSYKNQQYGSSIVKALGKILFQSFTWRSILFGAKFLQKGFFEEDKQIEQHVQAIKMQTKSFILERFQQISQNEEGFQNNILSKIKFKDYILNQNEQQIKKKIENITGDVLLFFFAGTDTLSSALVTTLHMIGKYAQVKEKLIEQINKNRNIFEPKSLKNLKYMDAVFNEVLRLYGPANWIFPRLVKNQPTNIGGVNIPAGSLLTIQTQSIHCSERYYEKPYQFVPQRWIDKKIEHPFSFVAFGAGNRNCIGQHLAKIQYKISLIKILQNYTIEPLDKFQMSQPFVAVPLNNTFRLSKILRK